MADDHNASASTPEPCVSDGDCGGAGGGGVGGVVDGPPPKAGEYQFQMSTDHVFKGKHGKKLYKCDLCLAVYRHSFSLKRHFIRSHVNYGYLCDTDVTNCGINLAASASLQTWRQQRAGEPPVVDPNDMPELYCCHSCVLFFDDLPAIKAHVDDCHRNNSSGTIEPIRIPCSHCNMSFIQRHNLVRHVEVVHQGKRLYACKHCSKRFQTIADRKKHEKSSHHQSRQQQDSHHFQHHNQQLPQEPYSAHSSPQASRPTAHPGLQKSAANSHRSAAVHKCLKCAQWLPSYPELRKHAMKRHKECYHSCGFCNKFYFIKKQLTKHLRQKHEKTAKENAQKLRLKKSRRGGGSGVRGTDGGLTAREETAYKSGQSVGAVMAGVAATAAAQQQLLQQNQFQAYFHCSLCYRRFLTYGSLIRHKQVAHRTTHSRSCSRLTAADGPPMDRELAAEPRVRAHEFEFYQSLAQKVAENLLYFVDGKCANSGTDYKAMRNTSRVSSATAVGTALSAINLTEYNFPEDYGRQTSSPPSAANAAKLEFLFDCNLNTVKNPKFEPLLVNTTDTDSTALSAAEPPPKPLYICTTCRQKVSKELIPEHEANNHPNVFCTYVELEPMADIPPQLLLWQYHCSEGLLHKCPTAPTLANKRERIGDSDGVREDSNNDRQTPQRLKCTKCDESMATVALLHNHILECAHNYSSTLKIFVTAEDGDNSHENVTHHDISTQTIPTVSPSAASVGDTSLASHSSTATDAIVAADSTTDTSLSSNATEKAAELSSPLSPSKTRSGKRRQVSPEELFQYKRTRNSSKNSSNESMVSKKSNTSSEARDDSSDQKTGNKFDDNCVDGIDSTTGTDGTTNECNTKSSNDSSLPKRYSCKKCTKKFVYKDSLSKHQMSCKRLFSQTVANSGRHTRTLRQSTQCQQKVLSISELKAIAREAKQTSIVVKCDENLAANEDTEVEDEMEAEEEDDGTECEAEPDDEKPASPTTGPEGSATQTPKPQTDSSGADTTDSQALQEHRCPDCDRIFTYLANFRKHIKNICPKLRKQVATDSPSVESTPPPLTSTPIPRTAEDHTSTPDVIVIKQELDVEAKDSNNNNDCNKSVSTDEESAEIKTKAVDDDEEEVSSVLPKDESKLDLFRVKQENPMFAFKGSPAQHHSCPYCQRGFTYLANYRKHIKSICPIRQQIDDKKQQVIDNSATDGADGSPATASKHLNTDLPPTLVFTPSSLSVRSQIEDTVLTLLRDQTKQDQILQSSEQLVKSKQSHRTDGQSSGGQHSDSEATDESREDTTRGDESKDSVKKEWTQSSATTTPTKGSSFRFRTFSCSICHKIFLSYVTMLKHRLSHKLSDGSAAAAVTAADDDSALSTATHLSADDELVESNRDKEAANQALAASILKRSKDVIISKMRVHSTAAVGRSSAAKVTTASGHKKVQTVINTTDLLEKLARGGITTDAIHQLSAATVPKTGRSCAAKGKEVITIETNNNDSQTFNLQLSASTSGANQMTTSDGSLDEMVIDGKHLTDVLKEGVIVAQDLQHLMAVSDGVVTGESSAGVVCDEGSAKCAEVLLNLDDMESGNEVWITITGDSSALIQVPTTHTNQNSSPK